MAAAAAADAPAAKAANTGDRSKSGGKKHGSDDFADQLQAVQKLTLNNAQHIRMLIASAWDFAIGAGANDAVEAGQRAGEEHNKKAKEGGKMEGPPHVYVATSFVDGLQQCEDIPAELRKQIQQQNALLDAMTIDEISEVIPYFRLKKGYAETGQPQVWKLNFVFNPLAASPFRTPVFAQKAGELLAKDGVEVDVQDYDLAQVRAFFRKSLNAIGFESQPGAPPPSALERVVQKHLRANQ